MLNFPNKLLDCLHWHSKQANTCYRTGIQITRQAVPIDNHSCLSICIVLLDYSICSCFSSDVTSSFYLLQWFLFNNWTPSFMNCVSMSVPEQALQLLMLSPLLTLFKQYLQEMPDCSCISSWLFLKLTAHKITT